MKAQEKVVSVVGFGPVAQAITTALQSLGFRVKVIAARLPGQGITADKAAGIGAVFRPKSDLIQRFALGSYPSWMKLARDPNFPAVRVTRLITTTAESEPPWATQVEGYARVDEGHVEYITYTFAPVELGLERLQQCKDKGGQIDQRVLSPNEISAVLSGTSLPGSDYTIVTMGLDARDLRPDFKLYPTRGILVHFQPSTDITSYRHPGRMRTIYSRPDARVVGGTYEEHVGTLAPGEEIEIGEELVRDVNEMFGSDFRFEDRTKITVGFRPTAADPVFAFGEGVGFVNGLDGQGWVTGPMLGPYVLNEVCQKLGIVASGE